VAEESRPADGELIEFGPPARRPAGRGSRRQWIALGAAGFLAASAAGGLLVKYEFGGREAPAHEVVAPQAVDGYSRSANLETQLSIAGEAQQVGRASAGQASGVVSAAYQSPPADGASAQLFIFIGGELSRANPGTSMASFERAYPEAAAVPAGPLGGQAACTQTQMGGRAASMCTWFDDGTFGTLQSPTMTAAKLAATMNAVRPGLERDAKA
jgi:hypothetical protein